MRQFYLLVFVLLFGIVNAQNTYVPDNNFEQALIDLGYDTVLDDSVITTNIETTSYNNDFLLKLRSLTSEIAEKNIFFGNPLFINLSFKFSIIHRHNINRKR